MTGEDRDIPASAPPEHLPHRPTWSCMTCGEPWPCQPAREDLKRTLDPIALSMYATAQMHDAAQDLPASTAPELYQRFLRWNRP